MSDLSVANAVANLKAVVDFLDEMQKFGGANSPNIAGLENTLRATSAGNYRAQILTAVANWRSGAASLVTRDAARALIAPAMLEIMDATNQPKSGGIDAMVGRFYDYLHANSETFAAREFTYDSSITAGGSNVGGGTLYRVGVDRNGYELANATAETKDFECIADQQSGADRFAEVFRVRGAEPNIDRLAVKGSGIETTIRAFDSRDSSAILRNPGFDIGTAADPIATTTSITGWTADSVTGVELSSSTAYRTPENVTAAKAVLFTDNSTLTQVMNRGAFLRNVPYFCGMAVYRASSADGTLTISVGAVSRAITVSGLSNGAWTFVTIPATLGQNSYYDAFAEDQADFSIALTSNTTGTVGVDEIILAPMVLIDGTYYAIAADATPFQVGDTLQITDTGGTSGVMAEWIAYATGISLPTTTGTETYTDP